MGSGNTEVGIRLDAVDGWQPPEGQHGRGVLLRTDRGDIEAILHQDTGSRTKKAIVWVWGVRGGFDGPAAGIYGVLAEELKSEITSLRINYRNPIDLGESVLDTLAGILYLGSTGHTNVALVGHSFGGAVVISAAPLSPLVTAVVALSSQTLGAANVADVAPRPLLLVHGGADDHLPPKCSETIYEWAREPKELVIYPGARHGLRKCKDELHGLLRTWLSDKLNSTP